MPLNGSRAMAPCAGRHAGRTGVLALAVALLVAYAPSFAQDAASPAARGEALFREHGCYGCHTVGVVGTPIALDLGKIGAKHDRAYLERWLHDPKEQRPTAHMPRLALSETDAAALAAYLSTLK